MDMKKGTLIRVISGFYIAKDEDGKENILRCKKRFRKEGLSPMPGDNILFSPGEGEKHGWVEEVLPRKTFCLRPPVANVEKLIIVVAPVPEADLLLLDRQLIRAVAQEMDAVIAVNKCDLDISLAKRLQQEYKPAGFPVFSVSARTGMGVEQLKNSMYGKLCCMTGQSGTGKSSLLNALLGLRLETGDISQKISRGKNTTRQVELIEKDGLRVMDTAGFSLLEAEKNLEPEKLKNRYPEFVLLEGQCRFRECLHDREPGCAVAAAAANGDIHPARLERYRTLLTETREMWKERYG